MNFRTTIVLLALLAVAGVLAYFNHQRVANNPAPDEQTTVTTAQPKKLFDFTSGDIQRIGVKPAEGQPYALQRHELTWQLVEPVTGPADPFKANDLADALAALASSGQVADSDAASTGIDPPQYLVQIADKDGKTYTLNVGQRTGIGIGVYVRVGSDPVQISTADITEQLGKSPNSFRRTKLLDVGSPDINSLRIDRAGQTLSLEKVGPKWQLTAPIKESVDQSSADDLLYAISGLVATGFKGEDAAQAVAGTGPDAPFYRLDKPVLTVTYTAQPPPVDPTTQATTRPDTTTTVRFGGFSDVTQKDVYVAVSDSPTVVTVPATALDSFKKTPLDLRDRTVLSFNPDDVQSVSILSMSPKAPPHSLNLLRRKQEAVALGPTAPTSRASTGPSTTTAPAAPPSKWEIADAGHLLDADDAHVAQLLTLFSPLRADRYLEPTKQLPPATAPTSDQFIINLRLKAAPSVMTHATTQPSVLNVIDRGDGQPLIAQYNGQQFELPRQLADQFKADYKPGSAPPPTNPADAPDLTQPPSPPQ